MRALDGFSYSSMTAADSEEFTLQGGAYAMDAIASWGGGNIALRRLGPDGQTFILAATALSADGTTGSLALPPGTYKFVATTAAALSVSITRIPAE